MVQYLIKKNEIYWFRRKISNFPEIIFSLKTKDYDEALIRHSYLNHKIKTLIYKKAFKKMTVKEIREIINKYVIYMREEEYNDFEDIRDEELGITINGTFHGGHTKTALLHTIEKYRNIHQSNDIEKVKEITAQIFPRSNLEEDFKQLNNDKEKSVFHWELFKAEWSLLKLSVKDQEEIEAELEAPEQKVTKINDPSIRDLYSEETIEIFQEMLGIMRDNKLVQTTQKLPSMSISQLLEKYITERGSLLGGERNREDIDRIFRLFISWSNDTNIHELMRDDFTKFRDKVLCKLPSNIKNKKYRGKPTKEIVELAAKNDEETLSITTINKHLGRISQVFSWAANFTNYLQYNYSSKLQLFDDNACDIKKYRQPYTEDELKILFEQSPWFTSEIVKQLETKAHNVFLPLLALYTGAKPTELAIIKVADIHKKDGILGIQFYNTKTRFTHRFVPINKALIDLGLLKYVDYMKKNKIDLLFPNNTVYKSSTKFTNEFSIYNRTYINTDPDSNTSFYSIRHLVTQKLKNKKTELYDINDILGQSYGIENKAISNYGLERTSPKYLITVIEECLQYPFLDFTHIKEAIHKQFS